MALTDLGRRSQSCTKAKVWPMPRSSVSSSREVVCVRLRVVLGFVTVCSRLRLVLVAQITFER